MGLLWGGSASIGSQCWPTGLPEIFYGIPMCFPWDVSVPMRLPRDFHGTLMGLPWNSRGYRVGATWGLYGTLKKCP